jgi:nucleoside-diphosphate-sugar epimerase
MLEHLCSEPALPARTVVLGAGGFVGGAICARLRAAGASVAELGSKELDLCAPGAGERLASRLEPGDGLVFVSARAPARDAALLARNVAMAESVCAALSTVAVQHLVYISSDAVYGDDIHPLTERAPAAPNTLHGAMHLARELMLRSVARTPLAILRPTLLYGASDPHNGYGPNRFRRTAASTGRIDLFGEGEELRDHVLVSDVADVASGYSTSFRRAAELVALQFETPIEIVGSARRSPITHRHFDVSATFKAFPGFRYTELAKGIAQVHAETQGRQA